MILDGRQIMEQFHWMILRVTLLACLTLSLTTLLLQATPEEENLATESEAPSPQPLAPELDQAEVAEEATVDGEPAPDTEVAEAASREESYSNPQLTKAVATALYRQGYFGAAEGTSEENFIKAVKNYQTLNNMSPTGVVTPELIQSLGVGEDQFAPEE